MDPLDYVKIGESIASLSFIDGAEQKRKRGQGYEDACNKNQTRTEPTEDTKEVLEMYCEPNYDDSYCCDNSEKMCDFSTTPECPIFYGEIDRKDPLSFFTAYPSRHKFSLEVFQENGQDVNPMERMPKNPLTREDVEYWYKGGYHYGMPYTSESYPVGKAWYKNGDTYEGEFVYGEKEGKGTYTWPDGAKYEGDWKDDKREGKGTYTWPDGAKYEGDYKIGIREGRGILTYPDGRKYEGDWKDDKREGKGVFTWPNRLKLDGYWKNGTFRDGKGILTSPDGRKYEERVERR